MGAMASGLLPPDMGGSRAGEKEALFHLAERAFAAVASRGKTYLMQWITDRKAVRSLEMRSNKLRWEYQQNDEMVDSVSRCKGPCVMCLFCERSRRQEFQGSSASRGTEDARRVR